MNKSMERELAVRVIKQIMEICNVKSIVLNLHANNKLSKGFQIQIELCNTENDQSSVEKIAQKKGLLVNKTGNLLIIYKPQVK
ncbi:MAG: hypothetical protein NWE95_03530 [Candidatus Bathyarchaeota archaeon]|nr:hypothetical protein [Candidatus Bathyarchaeota archaeon]